MDITVKIDGYDRVFSIGTDIISLELTLGQQENSTSTSVVIQDTSGKVASDLVAHSIKSGGIKPLPTSQSRLEGQAPNTSQIEVAGSTPTPTNWDATIDFLIKECYRQGMTDKGQIAYLLATADGESGKGSYMVELWDGRGLQATYDGRMGNNQPGDGKRYRGRGFIQMTGKERYQYWSKVLGKDLVANPDLMASPEIAGYVIVRAFIRGEATGRKISQYVQGDKRDWYNARRVVNGIVPSQVNKYLSLAQSYYSQIDTLIARAMGGKAPLPTPTSTPKTPVSTNTQSDTTIYKGRKMIVNIGNFTYELYHMGTSHDETGKTTLTGQGIRWVLSRRRRNATYRNVSLKQLASQVAKSHKLQLDWLAKSDIQYQHVDQTGISDYQLLLREAKANGYIISEAQNKLTVKSLANTRDTEYLVEPGRNLIKYQIADQAIDPNKADESGGGVASQDNLKVKLDPKTGKLEVANRDLDNTTSQSVTGKSKDKVAGTVKPGQEVVASSQSQQIKRVKALPSSFTVGLDQSTLAIEPLSAIRTQGLPATFNRIWLVDRVTHKLPDFTTELSVYSPITVLMDNPIANVANSTSATPSSIPPGSGWIMPASGVLTSGYGARDTGIKGASRFHRGIDIAAPLGTPILASDTGVVTFSGVQSGYGNVVYIKHANGWTTRYGHNSKNLVRVGETVQRGQRIADMGSTGVSSGSHLHFEMRDPTGNAIDPKEVFSYTVRGNVVAGTKAKGS